jgi:hypothetical protein
MIDERVFLVSNEQGSVEWSNCKQCYDLRREGDTLRAVRDVLPVLVDLLVFIGFESCPELCKVAGEIAQRTFSAAVSFRDRVSLADLLIGCFNQLALHLCLHELACTRSRPCLEPLDRPLAGALRTFVRTTAWERVAAEQRYALVALLYGQLATRLRPEECVLWVGWVLLQENPAWRRRLVGAAEQASRLFLEIVLARVRSELQSVAEEWLGVCEAEGKE